MLLQRVLIDGERYINVTIHERHAKKLATLFDQVASKINNDNPFEDVRVLLNFRDGIHQARWGSHVEINLDAMHDGRKIR